MSTETTKKKIKIDDGTTFGRTYTDKAVDERLQGLVSTATFTPVKEKANNSLQKPAGLTKTKLVGVGTNGQENIEIGDNLTLANGKLSATGGGLGGDAFDVITLSDDGTTYTGTATGTKPLILKADWNSIVPQQYTYIEGLINSCQVIDNNKVTTYSFNNGKYTSKFSFIFYIHFITLTNSTDSIYIQYPTSNPDYKEPLDMTHLKRVLSGKKALCSGVLGNSAETRARPLYVAGNSQLTVYYVLNSDTNGTISEKSIENYTITDLVTPVD